MNEPENWNLEKIDEAALALLYLTSFRQNKELPMSAWKGHDWDVMNRLHEAGFISNPKGKAKSVIFTDEGWKKCEETFSALFTRGTEADASEAKAE